MANLMNYDQKENFDFGRVFSRAFMTLRRNFVAFFITSLIIVGIPTFLVSLWSYAAVFGAISVGDTLEVSTTLISIAIIVGIVTVIAMAILQGAITYGAVRDFNEEPRLCEAEPMWNLVRGWVAVQSTLAVPLNQDRPAIRSAHWVSLSVSPAGRRRRASGQSGAPPRKMHSFPPITQIPRSTDDPARPARAE